MFTDLNQIFSNLKHAFTDSTCAGCKRIATQFDVRHAKRRQLGRFPKALRPIQLHDSFEELDRCAKERGCVSCRVLRQALLLRQISHSEVSFLFDEKGPVSVSLLSTPEPVLKINVGRSIEATNHATLSCTSNYVADRRRLPEDPDQTQISQVAGTWLKECLNTHSECGRGWTSRNPTRLLRILPAAEQKPENDGKLRNLQLVLRDAKEEKKDYVALSYCWGRDSENHQIIQDGRTTTGNIRQRLRGFHSSMLPPTIQDAIIFTQSIGVEYIWIDSICIIQQGDDLKDFLREAPMMHEVYGNAYVTLCVCSNNQAIDSMFGSRSAWAYSSLSCQLNDQFIRADDMPFEELLISSPLASRAWTLQEERLSERIIYWTANRMYWSCARKQAAELDSSRTTSRALTSTKPKPTVSSPQSFLLSCWRGRSDELHDSWVDVVRSYCLRYLTNPNDRFAAISGLAARYAHASTGDRYLAGLWRKSFSQDLPWSVKHSAGSYRDPSLQSITPSWSWMSLTCGTMIETHSTRSEGSSKENALELLDAFIVNDHKAQPTLDSLISIDDALPANAGDETTTIAIGEAVKFIKVKAPMRPLLYSSSQYCAWSDVALDTVNTDGSPQFSFKKRPEDSVHSADATSGYVMAYESHKERILGKLDFLQYAIEFAEIAHEVQCLDIDGKAMLLLMPNHDLGYERIGIAVGYRQDFFRDVEFTTILIG